MSHILLSGVSAAAITAHLGGGGPTPVEGPRYWRIDWGFKRVDNIQMAEIEFRDEPAGPSKSVDGTILFSTQYNGSTFAAANAFDFNPATPFAHIGAMGNWVGYDFGASGLALAEIMLQATANFPSQNSNGFVVQYSNDGATWKPYCAISSAWSAAANAIRTYAITDDLAAEPDLSPEDPHRYWRVLTTQQGRGDTFQQINNIALLDALGTNLVISAGGTASASHQQGSFPAANAFDKNDATRWADTGLQLAEWLRWDFGLGHEQIVSAYKMKAYSTSNGAMPIGWKLQCSDDGVNWKTVDWQVTVPAWGVAEERTYAIQIPGQF